MLESLFIWCRVCRLRGKYTIATGAYRGDNNNFYPFCRDCLQYEIPVGRFVFFFGENEKTARSFLEDQRAGIGA